MKTKSLFGKGLLTFLGVSLSLGIAILAEGALHLQSTLSTSAAAANEAVSPAALAACPPSTISGTIGSGSAAYPFVTGTQTSRLFRNSVESDCGAQKPTPNLTD